MSRTKEYIETHNEGIQNVEVLIVKKLNVMNKEWATPCGVEWNERYKTLEEILTELKTLKL